MNLYSLHICSVVTNCSSILYLSPDLEAKKAVEAKAKKEEEKEEAARYASIEKKVAKARAEMAAEAAAAAEMAAAEKSTDTDDVQSMDIEEEVAVVKVAAELSSVQPMDLSDESDTQMGEEVEDGPGMQMIDAGDDGAEDGAGLFAVLFVYTCITPAPSIHILLLPFPSLNL